MIQSSRFELPESCTGKEATRRHLDQVAAAIAESISSELGREFEGRARESHFEYSGYSNWSWNIEVRRRGKLEASLSIAWSEDLSPTQCSVSIADAEERESLPVVALGLCAALGAALGPAIAPGAGLAFAFGGGAIGYGAALLWARVAARVRPRRRPERIPLLEALTRETQARLLPA
jgi:hypothetical protein